MDAPDRQVVGMWVAPEHRGAAVAHGLLRAAVGWAHEEGVATLTLWATDTNAPALALYRRSGFALTHDSRAKAADPGRLELQMRCVVP